MAKLCPLFNGSSGNSVYVGSAGQGILIDAGRSAKQIEQSLLNNQIDINSIQGIFITHEHTDHVSGLSVFATKYDLKIYASTGTLDALISKGVLKNSHKYNPINQCDVELDFATVEPFPTSHDCCESLGYIIKNHMGSKVAICTDLGYISDSVKESLCGCDVVYIESNHDTRMLQNGSYPYFLKRRILSNKGHLSNEACAEVLPNLVNNGTTKIVLSHLSSENNIPELAFQTALYTLNNFGMEYNKDFTLSVAPKLNNGECHILF